MDLPSLALFPENALDASVTTTVWVGVWVVVFFNLRFGWPLSGLVVPGYLVPLLIIRPVTAAVICVEAVVTYLVVWLLSERIEHRHAWCSLFGRDRFFALVLVSVLVRCVMDVWLFPWLAAQADQHWGWHLEASHHLHSYGLIVVALMANYFWKPGLIRGAAPMAINLLVTWWLVRHVLMEHTNFGVGSLQYLYDDIAASLLASPKAYIILILTAFVASRMNLKYAWDFNGILVPALLALQWQYPAKVLASFCEAAIIFCLATIVLRLPLLKHTTMEGGRKILLFFNIAFAYRMLLGHLLPYWLPDCKITDLYGFGYLLSTLMAVRAYDRHRPLGLANATLQVSLAGVFVSSLIGFCLTRLPLERLTSAQAASSSRANAVQKLGDPLLDVFRRDKLNWYRRSGPDSCPAPSDQQLACFREAIDDLYAYAHQQHPWQLEQASAKLARVHYQVQRVEGRYLYVGEREAGNRRGVYVVDCEHPDGLLVEVPRPLEEWATAEAGLFLWQQAGGGALAIAGTRQGAAPGKSSDLLNNSHTFFAAFHRVWHGGNTMQVRGSSPNAGPIAAAHPRPEADRPASHLWVTRSLPASLPLGQMRPWIESLEIHWQSASRSNLLRDTSRTGFGELFLSRRDRRRLALSLLDSAGAPQDPAITSGTATASIVARRAPAGAPGATSESLAALSSQTPIESPGLAPLLLQAKQQVAERGTNRYRKPRIEELLYMDEEVLRPLLRNICRRPSAARLSETDWEELRLANAAAGLLGYRLSIVRDASEQADFLIVQEVAGDAARAWGTYVFRFGFGEPYVIEVPRPLAEEQTYEYGVALFRRMQAGALLLAGAHPRANLDASSDVTRMANRTNLFHLVHQVLLREARSRRQQVVQVRAAKTDTGADLLMATSEGAVREADLDLLSAQLFRQLQRDGLAIRFVDGSPQTASYEPGSAQLAAMDLAENTGMLTLWLRPATRQMYGTQDENSLQSAQFLACGIPTVTADLAQLLPSTLAPGPQCDPPAALRRSIEDYVLRHDILSLWQAAQQRSHRLLRVLDTASLQTFLLVHDEHSGLPAVARLTAPGDRAFRTHRIASLDTAEVRGYVSSKSTWLVVEVTP